MTEDASKGEMVSRGAEGPLLSLPILRQSNMISMRWLACLGLMSGLAACWAQPSPQDAPPSSPPKSQENPVPSSSEINSLFPKPQIVINIREHQFSPDIVTITFLAPDYPEEVLRQQLDRVGSFTGSPPRGLTISRDAVQANTTNSFLKASFATDNIIDRAAGQLHLDRIIKPFLGAPTPHQISSFLVTFEGETPTQRTLRLFSNDQVLVSGSASLMPKGIEYKVLVRTQDPKELTIPTEGKPPEPAQNAGSQELSPPFPLAALLLLIAGSVAFGALVYFISVRMTDGRKP